MNKAYKIRNELKKVGREVLLADGDWCSSPFFAVIEPRWRYSKSEFENEKTEIGVVSADYYSYIGPFDHNIESISNNGFLIADGVKYIFKKKQSVKCGGDIQFFTGVLRRVWEKAMIYPDKFIDDFILKIKKNSFFDDKRVVRSFPVSIKPTLFEMPIISVGIKEMIFDENSVGENVKFGTIGVYANVYIPYNCKGITAEKIISWICKSVDDFNIVGIKVSETTSNSVAGCFVVKSVFTFNDEFVFGGNDDE